MSDDQKHSFVKLIPLIVPVYKEKLYDYLVSRGLDPHDEGAFPPPAYLNVDVYPYGSDDLFCESCIEDVVDEEITRERRSKPSGHYYTTNVDIWDTQASCCECGRRLTYKIEAYAAAKAVVKWTSKAVRSGEDLKAEDWYDLWVSTSVLPDDDELWDHIGYVLVQRTDLNPNDLKPEP